MLSTSPLVAGRDLSVCHCPQISCISHSAGDRHALAQGLEYPCAEVRSGLAAGSSWEATGRFNEHWEQLLEEPWHDFDTGWSRWAQSRKGRRRTEVIAVFEDPWRAWISLLGDLLRVTVLLSKIIRAFNSCWWCLLRLLWGMGWSTDEFSWVLLAQKIVADHRRSKTQLLSPAFIAQSSFKWKMFSC